MARVVWSRLRVVKEKFGDRASVASGCDHRDASHGASCVCTRIVDDPVRAIGPPPRSATLRQISPAWARLGLSRAWRIAVAVTLSILLESRRSK